MIKVKKILACFFFLVFILTVSQNIVFAAEVGDKLTAPEEGWQRFDDTNPAIKYSGGYTYQEYHSHYNGTAHYIESNTGSISFEFKGTKLRILGYTYPTRVSETEIYIDGVKYTYSDKGGESPQILLFEKTGLENKIHEVRIMAPLTVTGYTASSFDAFEFDDEGELFNESQKSVLYNKLDNSASISAITDGNYQSFYTLNSGNSITYTLRKNTLLKEYEILTGETTGLSLDFLFKDKSGNVVKTISNVSGGKYINESTLTGVKYVTIQSKGTGSININELALYGEEDETAPADVTSVTETHSDNTVTLYWKNPTDPDFKHVNLYKNSTYIASTSAERYDFINLLPATTYNFKITAVDLAANESGGVNTSVTTNGVPKPEEVKNVSVYTEYNRVNLSWSLPTTVLFRHVNIYRKDVSASTAGLDEFFYGSKVYAADESFKPLFETNGTYFNDLSVEADSEYKYLLTTENEKLGESEGVQASAITPPVPILDIGSIDLPFSASGMLDSAMGLILLISPFILLALAIHFAPRMIQFLKGVIAKYKEGKLRL